MINTLYIYRVEEFNQPIYLIEEQARQVMSINTYMRRRLPSNLYFSDPITAASEHRTIINNIVTLSTAVK